MMADDSSSLGTAVDWSDIEEPLLSSSISHDGCSSDHGRCAACSNRQQRSNMIWAVLLIWTIPVGLAAGRCMGWWGPTDHRTNQQPQGHLLLTQVVFRHGARTPLSQNYWPNSTWSHCSQHPLEAAHGSVTNKPANKITLRLYDPSGAAKAPPLSGDEKPQLAGGCRMGSLTDVGFTNAIDLGATLRRRYIDRHKLLPPHQINLQLLHAESTAVQRTVTTLRGVLTGLYPNSSAVVPVAVRPDTQEVLVADRAGCPALTNLTAQLATLQKERDQSDPLLQELKGQVRLGLQLPPDSPVLWSRLNDELACMAAEGQEPAASLAQPHLRQRIAFLATQHALEVSAPEPGGCLLGKDQQQRCQQATALSTGRLLHLLHHNMAAAAAAHTSSHAAGHRSSTLARRQLKGLTHTTNTPTQAAQADAELELDRGQAREEAESSAAEATQAKATPRLMLYSAHDVTLLPLLSALGQQQTSWPDFASHLAFELWQNKHQYEVRVLYNEEPLRLQLSTDQDVARLHGQKQQQLYLRLWRAGAQWCAEWSRVIRDWMATLMQHARAVINTAAHPDTAESSQTTQVRGPATRHSAAAASSSTASPGPTLGIEGGIYTSAYVVTLDEFKDHVVQHSILSPTDYAKACAL